ncbi:MAG: hypothetical protein EAX87_09080 [Candidatus Thorarchaeota archaeon]|nr:hypothetical protein [Candidatus Thorarchaeota archaeon]
MPGLIARKVNGDLNWFPLFDYENNHSFCPPPGEETGTLVGEDWFPDKTLSGYWTPEQSQGQKRRIGGGSSFIVLQDGMLRYFPFKDHTFLVPDAGRIVGKNFRPTLDYYVAEWTNNGTSDLLVRDEDGDLRLHPFDGHSFIGLGKKEKIGRGFTKEFAPEIYPGHWTSENNPDLLVRMDNGTLVVYPFDGEMICDGKKFEVATGFGKDYSLLLVDEWLRNGSPDIIALRHGSLILFPYVFNSFKGNPQATVGTGFSSDWIYTTGHWRAAGRPDLVVCDPMKRIKFYPFDGGKMVDLGPSAQIEAKWKATHFWDFYPV